MLSMNHLLPRLALRPLILIGLLLALSISFANSSSIVNAQSTVRIPVGSNIQNTITRYPRGTTFIIESGTHRMQSISPRSGDTFIGEDGAVLNGSRLLTSFQRRDGYWVATGQTQQGSRVATCDEGYSRCNYPEDLYFDDEPLRHVSSLSQVRAGSWYFNYDTNEVFFADDPSGHKVEISVTPIAFDNSASNVTVRNLTVEKYATPGQIAAINASTNWVIEEVTARLNHSVGMKINGYNSRISNSRMIRNGMSGIFTFRANGSIVEGNEIAHNNYARFSTYWGAGGSKFAETDGLTIRNNYVHHNYGKGLWTDINNDNIVYDNNLVTYNREQGIYQEISFSAIIRNNVVMFNGNGSSSYLMYGAQILLSSSQGIEIYNNRVVVNDYGRGIGVMQQKRGDWLARNNYIHHNVVVHMARDGHSGVMLEPDYPTSRSAFWDNSNNRFDYNAYYVSSSNAGYTYWRWDDLSLTWSGLRGRGQEQNGRLITSGFGSLTSIPGWSPSTRLPIGYPGGSDPAPQPTATPAPQPSTGPAITSFTLVSADTQRDLLALNSGTTINLSTLPTQRVNIRANVTSNVRSVNFRLNSESRTESVAPFVLWGDEDGRYLPGTLRTGSYTLTGIAYTLTNRGGSVSRPFTVTFTVTNSSGGSPSATPRPTTQTPSVTSFTLINAENQTDIRTITNGSTINLATLPCRYVNIRVNTNPARVGSVRITVNGQQTVQGGAPYSVFGDTDGRYLQWRPNTGSYTISAIAYSGTGGTGTASPTVTLRFSVINQSVANEAEPTLTPTQQVAVAATPLPVQTSQPITSPGTTNYTLQVQANGGGSVVTNPNATTFAAGSVVTLAAIPQAGWDFIGWSGGLSGNQSLTTVTMNNNISVVANFAEAQLPPTITPITVQPLPLPVLITFDGAMDTPAHVSQPTNWISSGGWQFGSGAAVGGAGNGWYVTATTQSSILALTQPIDLRSAVQPVITFQSLLAATQHSPALEISTNNRDWVLAASPTASPTWTSTSLSLTQYTGQMIWLRWSWSPFGAAAGQTGDGWMIDDISVAEFVPPATATPLPTPLPTETVSQLPLVLTSFCAGAWEIDNLNNVPVTYTWEFTGTGVRSEAAVANPGKNSLITGLSGLQAESVTLYFDLQDGFGERSVTQIANNVICQ
ncbi:MAG: right-handed parallel beta-helix repeat-containing protein [bacterium]|nr:right-handed parallel beta-helix repeat-containing protein [bacterium]